MNIDKFKQQHSAILAAIDDLRQLARGGVAAQAQAIAAVVAMSGLISCTWPSSSAICIRPRRLAARLRTGWDASTKAR
jgi:hypothetical protein